MKITEAIILAGGEGSRLQAALPGVPKCLAPVNNTPFIDYLVDHLLSEGIEKFIFALGVGAGLVKQHLDDRWPALQKVYAIESEPLGTGGAIKNAVQFTGQQHVLVVNGDTLFKFKMKEAVEFHLASKAVVTIFLKPLEDFSRYGTVELDEKRRVVKFQEKKPVQSGLINAGAYLLDLQQWNTENFAPAFSFEKEYLETHYTAAVIMGVVQDAYFIDIGIPPDYQKAQIEFLP